MHAKLAPTECPGGTPAGCNMENVSTAGYWLPYHRHRERVWSGDYWIRSWHKYLSIRHHGMSCQTWAQPPQFSWGIACYTLGPLLGLHSFTQTITLPVNTPNYNSNSPFLVESDLKCQLRAAKNLECPPDPLDWFVLTFPHHPLIGHSSLLWKPLYANPNPGLHHTN